MTLVATVALVVGATMTILRTEWGGDLARRLALPRINAAIAGRLEIRRFRFGGDHLTIDDLELRGPDQERVAGVRRIEVAFSPWSLLRGRVDLRRVDVDGPSLFLRQDEYGLNLTRALSPRRPRPSAPAARAEKKPASAGGLRVDLAALRLSDGLVQFQSAGSGAPRTVRVENLSITGHTHYQAGPPDFSLAVQLNGAALSPLAAPISLRASGDGHGDRRALSLTATVGDASVEAALRTGDGARAGLRLSRAHLTPALVRALAPALRLRVPIDVAADGQRDGSGISFTATIDSVAGSLAARGAAHLATAEVRPLGVTIKNLDLGRLFEGLPRSALSLNAQADGGGKNRRALTGALSVTMPAGTLGGAVVGPLALRVNADRGHYQLTELRASLPGLVLTGQGQAGPERLDLHVGIAATNLRRASRTAAGFEAARLPPVAGVGQVSLSLFGTVDAPGVEARALFPRLSVGGDRLDALSLFARVPDLHAPQSASGRLTVARAKINGRTWQRLAVNLQTAGRRLALDAQAGGVTPLSLAAAGTWGADRRSVAIDRFDLHYPTVRWRLNGAARVAFGGDRLAVEGWDLRAGPQRIAAAMDKRGDRLQATLALEHIDLGAIPRTLLPPRLVLAGQLDVHAQVAGTLERPRGQATISLVGGRFGDHRDLSLDLDGHYGGGRARGRVAAQGLGTSVRARFDLPTAWPLDGKRGPVELELTMPATNLSPLLMALRLPVARRLSGKVALSLQLHGTFAAPTLRLDAWSQALVVDGQMIGDVSLRLAGDAAMPLSMALEVRAPEGADQKGLISAAVGAPLVCAGVFNLRTGLSLAALLRGPPSAPALMRTHFDVSGDLRGLPLSVLGRLARSSAFSNGTASLRLSGEGTALAPTGALNVQVAGATGPRFPLTDGRLDVAFGPRDTRVAAQITRRRHVIASTSAILGLASRQLSDRAALARAPLTVRAALGPLQLRRQDVPVAAALGMPEMLSTVAQAVLSIDGTLADPRLTVNATLTGARLGTKALGQAQARVTYVSRRLQADAQFQAVNGGALHLAAASTPDLGFPQLLHAGATVGKLPLDVTIQSQRFDLDWLSGFSQQVRRVGGALSADITARGTLAAPAVSGQLEWTDGALALTGLGDYRNVHLKAHGNQRAVWLDELRLESGEGNARLTGSAAVSAAQRYDIKSSMTLRRFPVYGQGQPLAFVSLDANLSGAAAADGARARVTISDAHVDLTDAKQKKLQPLDRPPNVVMVKGGEPINRAEAVKLAALSEALREAAAPASSGTVGARAAPTPVPFKAHVTIDAPRNLWVNGKDAALELGLGPDFHVEADGQPRIYGRVAVRRGRIDILGRRFDLQAGSTVQFIGPPSAPRVDVSAKYFNETENVTVNLAAKGTIDHLAITVSSPDRPDLTEGQLYTLIVTGRLQLGGNSAGSVSASSEAASLVGGLVASQLQKTLAKRLPLDVLTLQAGEGLSGSRLEAGTYLTSKLYAGYVGRVGANPALLQNRNAVHLEYQLSRRWSFDGEYGDVGTGTADLLWTKNY
ncbi:MAG TPA: translocation/assembly module TamB domain-containing protein [Polyangia bacterium]|nr:translocation/assembly module TamB domain-containing protein [Polyangia bacterium]